MDHSNSVNKSELKMMLSLVAHEKGIPDSLLDSNEVMDKLDKNKDGVMNLEEFTVLFREILMAMANA